MHTCADRVSVDSFEEDNTSDRRVRIRAILGYDRSFPENYKSDLGFHAAELPVMLMLRPSEASGSVGYQQEAACMECLGGSPGPVLAFEHAACT